VWWPRCSAKLGGRISLSGSATGRDNMSSTWRIVGRLLGVACVHASPTLMYRSTSFSG